MSDQTKRLAEDTIENALGWALDLIDMYDERLVALGDPPEKVYSAIHLQAKTKARNRLRAVLASAPQAEEPTEAESEAFRRGVEQGMFTMANAQKLAQEQAETATPAPECPVCAELESEIIRSPEKPANQEAMEAANKQAVVEEK